MFAQRLFQNFFWIIGIKFPIEGNWINVVPPAENALVGARDIGRVLHTLVRRNAVEGVFVAAPLALEHRLGPAAEFRGGVAACPKARVKSQQPWCPTICYPSRNHDPSADILYCNAKYIPNLDIDYVYINIICICIYIYTIIYLKTVQKYVKPMLPYSHTPRHNRSYQSNALVHRNQKICTVCPKC